MALGRGRNDAPPALAIDVDPKELAEFQQAAEDLARAERGARNVPAELTFDNKGLAADALRELRYASKEAEAARKKITKRFDDAKGRVKAAFDELRAKPDAAAESIGARLVAVEEAEAAKAAEERRREEAEARKAQEEENRRAAEEKRASHHVPPPAPKKRPTGARGSSGAKASVSYEMAYEIVNPEAVPDRFKRWEWDRTEILKAVRNGEAIPGVRPFKKPKVTSR